MEHEHKRNKKLRTADYDRIAETYDRGRAISKDNIVLWLDDIAADYPPAVTSFTVVDVGCGTGRFALPLAYDYGYDVIAVDRSEGMLAKGREKDRERRIQWVKADAASAFLPPGTCDVVFMSHIIHHVADPVACAKGCFEIIRPGGSLYIRYGAMEHIIDDVVHRFFPRTVALDQSRTPTTASMKALLHKSGFSDVHTVTRDQQTYPHVSTRRISLVYKGTSVQTFLSEEEHRQGLERFDAYAAAHPDDPWILTDRISLVRARKT